MRPLRIQPRTARFHVATLLMKLGAENLTSSIGKPRSDAAASTSPATRVGVVGLEVCEGGHRGGSPMHPGFAELALSGVGGHGRLPGRPRFEDLKHAAGRLAEEPHEIEGRRPRRRGSQPWPWRPRLRGLEHAPRARWLGALSGRSAECAHRPPCWGLPYIPTLEDEVQAVDECCPEAHFHGHQPGHFAVIDELRTPFRRRVLESLSSNCSRTRSLWSVAKCSVTHVPYS